MVASNRNIKAFQILTSCSALIFSLALTLSTSAALAQTDAGTAPGAASGTAPGAQPSASAPKAKTAKKAKAAKPAAAAAAKTEAPKDVKIEEDAAAPADANGDKILLKFNTTAEPSQTDIRAPIKFKIPGAADTKPTDEETNPLSEDAPYKAYIGYPKHDFGVFVEPMDLSSHWEINGTGFNFTDTPTAYGVNYKAHLSPLMNFAVEYMHFSDAVTSSKVKTYVIQTSTFNYDTLFIDGDYCFVSDLNFFNRWCPGVVIGRDEYPILATAGNSNTTLALNKVADFTVGVKIGRRFAIRDTFQMGITAGYNLGTGMGNSGSLTSTTNSSYYVKALADWSFKTNHTANFQFDYFARAADLEGKNNAGTIKWTTSSSVAGLRVGYTYTFQ